MDVGSIATYLDEENNLWAGQVVGREYAVGEIPPEKPGQPSQGVRRVNTGRFIFAGRLQDGHEQLFTVSPGQLAKEPDFDAPAPHPEGWGVLGEERRAPGAPAAAPPAIDLDALARKIAAIMSPAAAPAAPAPAPAPAPVAPVAAAPAVDISAIAALVAAQLRAGTTP